MAVDPNYLSDTRPDFTPVEIDCGRIQAFTYTGSLVSELKAVNGEVEVRGEPSLEVTFKGLHPHDIESGLKENPGLIATAMHCVNAVPYVCEAEPGIKTYLDLPFTTGRADMRLRD